MYFIVKFIYYKIHIYNHTFKGIKLNGVLIWN